MTMGYLYLRDLRPTDRAKRGPTDREPRESSDGSDPHAAVMRFFVNSVGSVAPFPESVTSETSEGFQTVLDSPGVFRYICRAAAGRPRSISQRSPDVCGS